MKGDLAIETCKQGHHTARYRQRTYRFLLSNGETVDVVAARDDSDLRAAVVEQFVPPDGRIEGVAALELGDG